MSDRDAARFARANDLSVELADDGELDAAFWQASGIPVATIQCWWMHDVHPIHVDPAARSEAQAAMGRTMATAERLGIPFVLAVCGFGQAIADRPFERSLEFFARWAGPARDAGLRILVEPLSSRRCSAFNDPSENARLIDALAAEDVFSTCFDTGHLTDDGHDLDALFTGWGRPLGELQVKGPDSSAPPTDLPLARWFAALCAPPEVVSIEHNRPVSPTEAADIASALRAALA